MSDKKTEITCDEDQGITWMTQVYSGVEISKGPPGVTLSQLKAQPWMPGFEPKPVRGKSDLKEGDVILVPSMFSKGRHFGTFHIDREGRPYFLSHGGSLSGMLEWDLDDRHCWTCAGLMNLQGIKKGTL